MTLEELVEKEKVKHGWRQEDFEEYINTVGLNNIKNKDLELIIDKYGVNLFNTSLFPDVYKLISEKDNNDQINKTNRTMKFWTITIGIMTAVMTIMTVLMYLKPQE